MRHWCSLKASYFLGTCREGGASGVVRRIGKENMRMLGAGEASVQGCSQAGVALAVGTET